MKIRLFMKIKMLKNNYLLNLFKSFYLIKKLKFKLSIAGELPEIAFI